MPPLCSATPRPKGATGFFGSSWPAPVITHPEPVPEVAKRLLINFSFWVSGGPSVTKERVFPLNLEFSSCNRRPSFWKGTGSSTVSHSCHFFHPNQPQSLTWTAVCSNNRSKQQSPHSVQYRNSLSGLFSTQLRLLHSTWLVSFSQQHTCLSWQLCWQISTEPCPQAHWSTHAAYSCLSPAPGLQTRQPCGHSNHFFNMRQFFSTIAPILSAREAIQIPSTRETDLLHWVSPAHDLLTVVEQPAVP